MNWTKTASALASVAAWVAEFAPAAEVIDPAAAPIVTLVQAAATYGEAVLASASGAEAVISSSDLASIQASVATIRAQNDSLAAQVAAS